MNSSEDEEEAKRLFVQSGVQKDFIQANMPVLTYYLPVTSMMFLYIKFIMVFEETSGAPDYFYHLFVIIICKSVLTAFFFHISFYSAKVTCWDKIGIYVHLGGFILTNIVGPILMVVFGAVPLMIENSSPFH